ncbi:MAG: GTPase domain-containing protein, partial [Planctomycetales bacterium]
MANNHSSDGNPPSKSTGPDQPRMLTRAELDQLEPIVVSVVGPTNQGKTCVIRTLSEDGEFGEVRDEAGVTRKVKAKKFLVAGTDCLHLWD